MVQPEKPASSEYLEKLAKFSFSSLFDLESPLDAAAPPRRRAPKNAENTGFFRVS
jgi:hypothetical protein